MKNRIWENGKVHNLKDARSNDGKKVMEDYSGFHRPEHSDQDKATTLMSGSKAAQHLDASFRRSLNEGENFDGCLIERTVGHTTLLIGTHPQYGLAAYINQRTSHPGNAIEVLYGDTSLKALLKRSDFFGQLSTEPPTSDALENICRSYYARHIAMN